MVDICPGGWLQRDTNVFVNMKEVVGFYRSRDKDSEGF